MKGPWIPIAALVIAGMIAITAQKILHRHHKSAAQCIRDPATGVIYQVGQTFKDYTMGTVVGGTPQNGEAYRRGAQTHWTGESIKSLSPVPCP